MGNEELILKMILDESGFKSGLDNAVKKLGDFDGQVSKTSKSSGSSMGNIWTSFVGNFLASGATKVVSTGIGMITSNLGSAINRVDTLANSNRVFANMGFSVDEVDSTIKNLTKSITGMPTAMDTAIQGLQLIASSTNNLSKSEQIFTALNNGILGFGGSTDMVQNALVQLSQAFSNGKIDAQTWNSMINSGLGPALNALAKEMGLTTGQMKEGLSDGTISVEQFQDALIDLNKNGGGGLKSLEQIAKDSTSGIKTGIANMKTAITRGVANMVTGLNEGLTAAGFDSISEMIGKYGSKIEETFTKIGKGIPDAIKSAKELYNTLVPYAPLFVGLIAGLTTFTTVLKIQQTIDGVSKAFKTWKATTEGVTIAQKILNATLLANPIALVITAIVALTAGIFYLWKTNEDFRIAVKKVWADITVAAKKAADKTEEIWKKATEFLNQVWADVKKSFSDAQKWMQEAPGKAADYVKEKWDGVKTFFSDLWIGVKKSFDETWNGIAQQFSNTWEAVSTIVAVYWEAIVSSITSRVSYLYSFVEPYVLAIGELFSNTTDFIAKTWDNLKKIASNSWVLIKNAILAPALFVTSLISGGWEEARDNMIAIWGNIKEASSEIWGALTSIFVDYFNMMKDNAIAIWEGVRDTLVNIWSEIANKATSAWNDFRFFLDMLWIDIKLNITLTWIDIKYFFIFLWNDIKYGAMDAWRSIQNFFKETWENITNGAMDKWINFQFFILKTWDNIKTGTKTAWEGIKNGLISIWDGIINGAKEAWRRLKQSVSDTIDTIKDTFNKLKDINLFDIGKNIIQGLIDGIGEMIGAVGKKIKSVASTIKNGIKGALDIHSPSRWMRDMIGKNISLGVIEGIESKQGELDKTVADMANFDAIAADISGQASASPINNNVTQSTNDVFNINLQAMGELSEVQLMDMAKKLVKCINDVRERENMARGGVFGGI